MQPEASHPTLPPSDAAEAARLYDGRSIDFLNAWRALCLAQRGQPGATQEVLRIFAAMHRIASEAGR